MEDADFEFIVTMARQLEDTIKKLAREENRIKAKLDEARIEELYVYWRQEMQEDDGKELIASLDHWDKMLLVTWNRKHRAQQSRVQAGKAIMKQKQIKQDKDK